MPAKFLLEHGHRPCSSQCGWEKKKKAGGLLSCWVSAESAGPDLSVGRWLPCFVWKPRGWGGEILSVCLEFYVRKQRKVREFFQWAKPAKSTRWLIIITLLAELGGSDWLVISFIGGEGQYWLLGLDRLETQLRHLIWNPHRILLYYIKLRV